jgi:hypothetical protein
MSALSLSALSLFGFFAVGFTLLCYLMEERATAWILGFAGGCAMSAAYGFLQGAWPFGLVEIVWTLVALRRWWRAGRAGTGAGRASEPIA